MSDKIQNKCRKIEDKIKKYQKELRDLQDSCPHENVFNCCIKQEGGTYDECMCISCYKILSSRRVV